MMWLSGAWAVFAKDIRLELRNRYALNALLLFSLSSLLVVRFAVGDVGLGSRTEAAILWIVILFSSAVGLGRSFVGEEERGTVLLLQLNTTAGMVLAGKLLFNFLLTVLLATIATVAFLVLLDVAVALPGMFFLQLLFGCLGLAAAMTLVAAIIARTANKGPLLAVLSFPLLIPLLLVVVGATAASFSGTPGAEMYSDLLTLVAYAGTVITAAFLLFRFVWTA